MNIRRALLSDIEKLAVLFDQYRVFYDKSTNVKAAEHFLTERITKNESVVFIAENDRKELTGFVQLYPIFSSTRMKRLWLLNDLFVQDRFRSQNISIQLIDAAKKLAVETESAGLILETAKSNFIGNKLYPRTNFELDNEHNYYSWSPE
ncbi:MAG: GNAT family N-acetyltransferase [Saprospiraceae bacterium]